MPGSGWGLPAEARRACRRATTCLVYAEYAEDELEVELVGHEVAARHGVALTRSPSPLLQDARAGARAAWLHRPGPLVRPRARRHLRQVPRARGRVLAVEPDRQRRHGDGGDRLGPRLRPLRPRRHRAARRCWRSASSAPSGAGGLGAAARRARRAAVDALLAELRMTELRRRAGAGQRRSPPVPVPPVRSRRSPRQGRRDLSGRTAGPTSRPSWPARTRATACATRTPGCGSGPSAPRPTPTRATSWR